LTLCPEPRRAAVALVIRVVPSPTAALPAPPANPPTLTEFFELDWVNDPNARPEILFLRRDNPAADEVSLAQSRLRNTQEAHVAFPGGRMEPEDEGGLYTGSSQISVLLSSLTYPLASAMRQTWEEIGIDLAERQYTSVGQLDDREITTSLGKRLLMILSPFVFLQVTPHAPPPDPVPSTSLHWTPLASLVSPFAPPRWSTVTVDAASRLAPKHSTALRLLVRVLIGSMEFPAILLDTSSPSSPIADPKSTKKHDILEKGIPSDSPSHPPQNLKLWGLSLGMMLDLMSYMIFPPPSSKFSSTRADDDSVASPLSPVMQLPYQTDVEGLRMDVVAPSLASVFPRFSYPDVNFWIW
jgi:8-oxo-dGTP pyrophosphatase MutT (NUDIX family)